VTLSKTDGSPIAGVPSELTLLGHSDHLLILTNGTYLYRIEESSVVLSYTMRGNIPKINPADQ